MPEWMVPEREASVVLIISREPALFLSSPSVRLLSKHFDLCAALPSPFPPIRIDRPPKTPQPARWNFVAVVHNSAPPRALGSPVNFPILLILSLSLCEETLRFVSLYPRLFFSLSRSLGQTPPPDAPTSYINNHALCTPSTLYTHAGFSFSFSRRYLDLSILVQRWYIVARVRGYYTVPLQRHACAARQQGIQRAPARKQ